jgi:site-specific DNA recombinase
LDRNNNITSIPFPKGSLVAAYLRDSGGDEQEQSVVSQERAVRDWCIENGLELTRIFQDSKSGTSTAGRNGFNEMMAYFTQREKPPEAGVVLWTYSRFAREINDSQYYKAELRRRGFIIHSLNDSVPDGLEGRLIESILEWKDASFSRDLSIHVKRGLNDMVRNNGGVPGTPPRGFKRERLEIGKHRSGEPRVVHKWVPDPETLPFVKKAWAMRAEGQSYQAIMQALPNLYKSRNCYPTFFSNPIYKGELHFGDQVIPNYCEPVVSHETWAKVQEMTPVEPSTGEPKNHPRRKGGPYVLSGLAYCGLCGAPLSGVSTMSKNRPHTNYYYICNRKKMHHDCPARNLPKDFLETEVIRFILENILDPGVLELYREEPEDRPQLKEYVRECRVELDRIKKVESRLLDAIEQGGDIPALTGRLKKLDKDRSILAAKLTWLQNKFDEPRRSPEEVAVNIRRFMEEIRTADPPKLHHLLSQFIKRIDVTRTPTKLEGVLYWNLELFVNGECPQGDSNSCYGLERAVS